MSQPEEASTGVVQFAWGEKRGRGKGKDALFYGSFVYDGIKYSLYDCVFMYQKNEPEPFIGKIVKIWEQQAQWKRVKVLWFFRPVDISNFLGDYEKNEIFLASGEGVGVFDVNPLEAIAGKCNVICTSKDKRNPQPSDDELKMADYIFYRTFDVGSYKISDKIGESVAGIEVKYIFNWKEALNNSVVHGRIDHNGTSKRSQSLHTESPVPEVVRSTEKNHLGEKTDSKYDPSLATSKKAGPMDVLDDRPSKKIRLADSTKPAEDLHKSGSSVLRQGVCSDGIDKRTSADVIRDSEDKVNSKSNADLVLLDKGSSAKSKLDTEVNRIDKSSKMAPPRLSVEEKQITKETLVVPRKPELDTSKWFTGLPWEDRMIKAHDQGTLVLLENFDIAYTSEEIEDLIYHFFKKKCTARIIEWTTFSNPYHGQALIICKNGGDADEIVKELKTRVLMLSNGRPLVGRRVDPKPAGKTSKFVGHYHVEKVKQLMQRDEWRKAVATSHCSQPNTIEYEMGIDWMLLQEKSKSWWKELHKAHEAEMRQTARLVRN